MTTLRKIILRMAILLMGAAMIFPAVYAVSASDGAAWETVASDGTDDDREASFRGDSAVHFSNPEAGMKIALTFDDGPHPKYTPEILDFLAENGIKATFFVVGQNAQAYPSLVKRELDEGHEVGNHTFSHAYLSKIPYREQCDEVIAAENAVFEENEYRTHLLRPPGGLYSETIYKIADRLDYSVILWSVDTRDWAHTPAGEIAAAVLGTVKGGDVILFHDFIGKKSPTLDALREIVPELKERGYEFVTVSELFGIGG